MTKLTTERLENIATWREKYGNGANVMIPAEEAELMARQLLAYEQAAEKPYGYLEPYDFPRTTATLYPEKDRYAVMPIYAAPVLPKQPVKPVMFIDGDISSDDAEKLAALIREFALDEETEEQQNEPQNIPENIPVPLELRYGDNVLWFLNELASFDASDIDCDGFDVYGEDRNGTEGWHSWGNEVGCNIEFQQGVKAA